MRDFQPALILFNAQGAPILACRSARALLGDRDPGELLSQVLASQSGESGSRVSFDGAAYRVFQLWLHSQTDAPPAIAVFLQPIPEPSPGLAELKRRYQFSRRESQVLDLAAEGLATKDIARTLGISAGTTSFFLRRVARKMGVAGRAEIMAKLIRGGGKPGCAAVPGQMPAAHLNVPGMGFGNGHLPYVRSAPSSLPVESPK